MNSSFKKLACACISTIALISAAGIAQAAWPERAVTIIVPWSAGGGTDATARMVAADLEKHFGQPFNVVNRTGGGGLVGHSAIANAKPDGYTIGVITIESTMYETQGLPGVTPDDYEYIGRYNADAVAINISTKADFDNAEGLLEAIKANPGKITVSGANRGGLSHLAWAGLLNTLGLGADATNFVASAGAAPALQQLAAGAIDVVSTSPAEARTLVEAGEAKTIALISGEKNALFPDLKTTDELFKINWSPLPFRGLAGPKGLPEEAIKALSAALKDITEDKEFQDFMKARGYSVAYQNSEAFKKTVIADHDGLAKAMKAVGLAK